MNSSNTLKINISKVDKSRIDNVDFNNLIFGNVFTDHMFECDHINGEWQNPTIRPYGPLTIDPSAKVFHYGQAVFEGMKAFKDEQGEVWLFRPEENYKRINKSAKRMAMPEFPIELFDEALHTLVRMDSQWVRPGVGNSLYIRPFILQQNVMWEHQYHLNLNL